MADKFYDAEADAPLLGGSSNQDVPVANAAQVSQYNFGPRKATDKIFGFIFVGFILAFFGWSAYGISLAHNDCGSNRVLLWTFNADEWVPMNGTCKRIRCIEGYTTTTTTPNPDPVDDDDGIHFEGSCEKEFATLIAVPLVVAVVGGILLGLLMLVGFKYQPYFMVYLSCVVQVLAPTGLGIYLIVQSHNANTETDAGTENSDGSQAFTYPAYFLFAVSFFLGVLYYFARASIKLCAELFQFAAVGMEENFCLIPLQTMFALVAMFIKCCMLAMIVVSICVVNIENTNLLGEEDDALDECQVQVGTQWHAYLAFSLFVLGWFAFWALETRNYITADVIGHWYWHGKEGSSITRGVKHVFCSHFGSMAFAGLCVWFIEWLKRQARTRPNHPIACLFVLIARCILSYIEYLFKMAVIVVAITGQDFASSGRNVGVLFWSSFNTMAHSTGVWYFPPRILGVFSVLFSAAWGALYGVSAYDPVKKDCEHGKLCRTNKDVSCHDMALWYSIVMGIVVWIIVWFLLAFFSSILLCIVDTAFMCFVMDKAKGVVTKPQFHRIFGTVLEYKAKTYKRRRGGKPEQPPRYVLEAAPQYSVQNVTQQPVAPPPAYPQPQAYPQAQGYPEPTKGYGGVPQATAPQDYPQAPMGAPPQQVQYDPMTGQPIQTMPQQQPVQYDPMTGQPIYHSNA